MKDVFSFITTTLFLTLIVIVCAGFISMELQVGVARSFHGSCVDRIQSSLYADEVIQECKDEADELGFCLEVEDVTIYGDRKDVKVTLKYDIPGWILVEKKSGTITGYAR